ncbi:MAG TPA: SDR family oxidoreductase [Candidatus Limnocylindrales bacterium]
MEGSTVVIGGAQGIGEAVARRLAIEPWAGPLVVADLNLERATAVAEDLVKAGADARAMPVNLSETASIDELVAATAGARRVAIVAGIFAASSSLDATPEEFTRILGVNLIGTFYTAQRYAAHMVEAGDGSIVGIASIAARMPRMRQAAYSASKAGMRQALRVLAMETVPRGVRINTVSPGPTDTPMMQTLARDHRTVDDLAAGSPEAFRPRIPSGRVGRPADIAAAVAFLLSPDAAHIAMQDLLVDGGESLGM